jgi:hypothetical protein
MCERERTHPALIGVANRKDPIDLVFGRPHEPKGHLLAGVQFGSEP